jgi:hypothetical protein
MVEKFVATPSCPWPLLTKEQIENSPSRSPELDYNRELQQTRTIVTLITKTGVLLSDNMKKNFAEPLQIWCI